MAVYPSFPQMEGTKPKPRGLAKLIAASNGQTRVRLMASARMMDWTLVHVLTAAQYATFLAFYDANRGATFTVNIIADGTALTCLFSENPFDTTPEPAPAGAGGPFWHTTVNLVQAS